MDKKNTIKEMPFPPVGSPAYGPWEKSICIKNIDNPLEIQVGGQHYKNFKIQPIAFIQANNLGFCEGNIVKYICRYKTKGTPKEDLLKIKHYVDILLKDVDV